MEFDAFAKRRTQSSELLENMSSSEALRWRSSSFTFLHTNSRNLRSLISTCTTQSVLQNPKSDVFSKLFESLVLSVTGGENSLSRNLVRL